MEQNEFKILIVDDGILNREMLRRILTSEYTDPGGVQKLSCDVAMAESGPEALEKIASDPPDLILLDIVMPDMSGFDVLSTLKKSEAASSIPVMIITGLNNIEAEEKGFALGAVDYITKPFHESLVRARVKIQLKIIEQLRLIEHLSLVDTLTNITNRRGFDNRMNIEWKRAIREKVPLSILMLDIDHFKKINDTYGHQQGDEVLKVVAYLINSGINRTTDLAARWGGEEFIALLPNTDLPGARSVAESIRARIENFLLMSIDGTVQLNVTISIGVNTIIPSIEDEIMNFIDGADKALYTAKKSGRNRVCSQE